MTDNGDGTLTPMVVAVDGEQGSTLWTKGRPFAFTNIKVTGSTSIEGTKFLASSSAETSLNDLSPFRFTLTPEDGAPLRVDGEDLPSLTVSSAVSGDGSSASFSFEGIIYQLTDLQGETSADFYYTVREVEDQSHPGVSFDQTVATVRVHVELSADGTEMTCTATAVDGQGSQIPLAFTNDYDATPTTATVVANKTINGSRPSALGHDRSFTFELVPDEGVSVPATTITATSHPQTGAVQFEGIEYTEPGTYTYTLREVAGSAAKSDPYTYDGSTYRVTVVVSDDHQGHLSAAVTYPDLVGGAVPTFDNTYTAEGKLDLRINKVMVGSPFGDADYTFKVSAVKTADPTQTQYLESGSTEPSEVETDADGTQYKKIVFESGGREYTLDSLAKAVEDGIATPGTQPGTWVINYVVTEDVDNLPAGVRPIDQELLVTVEVTDDGSGVLSTKVYTNREMAGDAQTTLSYRNQRINPNNVLFSMSGAKALENTGTNTSLGDLSFSFVLEAAEGTPMPDGSQTVEKDGARVLQKTVVNNTAGAVDFGIITFEKGDLQGAGSKTFSYRIAEVNDGQPGVTYDAAATRTVEVTVTYDENSNALVCSPSHETMGDPLFTFANSYGVGPTSVSLEATKTLSGAPLEEDAFSFEVYRNSVGANQTRDGLKAEDLIESQVNDASGNVTFSPIEITAPGITWYTVVEKAGSQPGVTYDQAVYNVRVQVRDDHRGGLTEPEVTYYRFGSSEPVEGITFANSFTNAVGEATIAGTKVLQLPDGSVATSTSLANKTFKFQIEAEGDAPLPASDVAATNASGAFSFGPITFDRSLLNGATSKDFTYKVTELVQTGEDTFEAVEGAASYEGVEYPAERTQTVVVTVTDTGSGLTTSASSASGQPLGSLRFVNTYTMEPTSAVLEAHKSVTGAGAPELTGGDYTFELYLGTLSSSQIAGTTPLATASNDEGGEVKFTRDYQTPGTYTYTIVEKAGAADGITYDQSVYYARVTVTDNHDGTLSAGAVTYSPNSDFTEPLAAAPTFTNTYSRPVFGSVEIAKSVVSPSGATYEIKGGEFSFTLENVTNTNGAPLAATQVKSNDAAGRVSFDELRFSQPGTYSFKVTEDAVQGTPGFS